MARIFLARHGQTAWNKEMIFRGRKDLPLSEHGHAQARAVAEGLASEDLTAVYASPMARAAQTAEPLAEQKGLEIRRAEGIIDADFGRWQGMTIPQVQEQFPGLYELWIRDPYRVTFPGGEAFSEIGRRAERQLRELAGEVNDGAALVVAHRLINKVILCALLGILETGFEVRTSA